ncbi:MAG: sulfate reduction electron transfer complex DsrMKJOP subunit DsrJ [Thermodesulfobacteriota bacterium]|jgi:hypothetical protein
MYDGKLIIPGLVVFVALMTFPIWKNMGNAGVAPKPEKPKGVTKCVEPAQYMRTSHMKLLDDWRDEVLRDGDRTPIEVDGVKYEKSLMNGCMKCHEDKKKFCDECHTYTSVKPYCWDCHFLPKETF